MSDVTHEPLLTILRDLEPACPLDPTDPPEPGELLRIYYMLRQIEKACVALRGEAQTMFCDQVEEGDMVAGGEIGGVAVGTGTVKVGTQGSKQPDNPRFQADLAAALVDELMDTGGINPAQAAHAVRLFGEVVSLNVSNSKQGGLKPLGLSKHDYYLLPGKFGKSLLLTRADD